MRQLIGPAPLLKLWLQFALTLAASTLITGLFICPLFWILEGGSRLPGGTLWLVADVGMYLAMVKFPQRRHLFPSYNESTRDSELRSSLSWNHPIVFIALYTWLWFLMSEAPPSNVLLLAVSAFVQLILAAASWQLADKWQLFPEDAHAP